MVTLTSYRALQREFLALRDGYKCFYCPRVGEEVALVVHHRNGNDKDDSPENTCLACKSCNQKRNWELIRGKARLHSTIPRRPPLIDAVDKAMRSQTELSNFLESDQSSTPTLREKEKSAPKPQLNEIKQAMKVSPINRKMTTNTRSDVCVSEPSEPAVDVAVRVDRALGVEDESPEMRVTRERRPLWVNEIYRRILSRDLVADPVTTHEAIYSVSHVFDVSPVTARRWLKQLLERDGSLELGQGRRGHQVLRFKEKLAR